MIFPTKKGSRATTIILVCLLPVTFGCAHTGGASDSRTSLEGIESIMVIGFRPVILPDEQPGMVRNSLTDAIRHAEPVPQDVADKLTYGLFDHLTRSGGYHFISPRDARSQSSTIDSPSRKRGDFDLYLRMGEALSADAFLAGYIWRWKERKGGEFAVEFPASVDFDLYLVRLDDKAVVWEYEYDKTQQSLAENFLDLRTFLRAKGTWLSASELAELGLEQMVEAFPKKGE